MHLLSESDCRCIEAAVAEVERHSNTELVVAVVERSAPYGAWRAGIAGMWGLTAGLALLYAAHYMTPELREWAALAAFLFQLPVAVLAFGHLGRSTFLRRLLPADLIEQAVASRALQLFAERRVYETRDRTGILLLISELEHRVVILGDRGIHERVGDTGWQHQVAHLIQRIRDGKPADGVLEVIAELRQQLEMHFPPRPDDTNELPNTVVRG